MASVQDYAVLSAYVYNDARGDVNQISISSDWQPIGDGISNNPSGFSANAFQNGNEIVIAFKGTDFLLGTNNGQTAADLSTDVALGTGFGSAQLMEAVQYYQTIKTQNPNAIISFTGHSLGAGLASIMSVWFDRPAIVFADAPFKATSPRRAHSLAVRRMK